MEILALTGSTRNDSYNTALLNAIAKQSTNNTHVSLFDSINSIPIFDPELYDKSIPEPVKVLVSKIRKSAGIIISTPEYVHGVSGVIKNLLDWLVASDAMVLKPVMVTSVSTSGLGGIRAFASLIQILSAMNTHVVIESSFCVPYASMKFDENLKLVDGLTLKRIELSMSAFEKVTAKKNNT